MIYYGEDKMPDFCNRRYPFHYATAINLLMKMGVDINRVEILAMGEYENYKGEVREQQPAPASPLQSNTKIVLKVGYPGAVDQLPYQFFYGLNDSKPRGGDWEMNARKLMAPYDAAVVRHEAVMRYQALKFSFGVADEEHLGRFLDLFAFDRNGEIRNVEDMIAWASLMPAFYLWGGSAEKTAEVLRLMFGYKFRIVENIRSEYEIPEGIRYRLGTKSGRLGRESVIGRSFAENDSAFQVVVSGVARQDMADFLPGGKKRKKLEWALSLCMPNDLDYRVTFDIENRAMVVGMKEEGTYLGYSTHLQRGEDRRQHRRRVSNVAQ
jgi:hypothetical protein